MRPLASPEPVYLAQPPASRGRASGIVTKRQRTRRAGLKHMRIWAISDLHLSFAAPKPMDIFGDRWRDHAERIARQWRRLVEDGDIVLLAGDDSWALRYAGALTDLEWIAALPGQKVLTKG